MSVRRCLFLILLILSFAGDVMASHQAGADLTYRCVGVNEYELTFVLYRDCEGINAPGSVTIIYSSVSCGITQSISINQLMNTGVELTPKCPTTNTACTGGQYPGLQEYVYIDTITLPSLCNDWVFSWNSCCRNSAINTISGGGESYVEARLNNSSGLCNSSPTFSNKPITFVLINEPFNFNHGALDIDGDSLVYSLTEPKYSQNDVIPYNSPYSYLNPIASSPTMTIDPITGDISVTPTIVGQISIMAVKVEEYRDGQFVGSVTRDMQIYVIECGGNHNPFIDGIDGTGVFSKEICSNQEFCFTTNSDDSSSTQIITLEWNQAIPNATFSVTNDRLAKGTFCWTPTADDVQSLPHVFTVTVKDNACPYYGFQVYSFSLYVRESAAIELDDELLMDCHDSAIVSAYIPFYDTSMSVLWNTFEDTTSIVVRDFGYYTISVTNDLGCVASDSINVRTATFSKYLFTEGCLGDTTFFQDSSYSIDYDIVSWDWDFGDGNTSTEQNPKHLYNSSGTYSVGLIVKDNNICVDTLFQNVYIYPEMIPDFGYTTNCFGDSTMFTDQTTPPGIASKWEWNFGNGVLADSASTGIVFGTKGYHNVSLRISDNSGCSNIIAKQILVNTTPIADFLYDSVCVNTKTSFFDISVDTNISISQWEWIFDDGDTSIIQHPEHIYSQEGIYTISLKVTNDSLCSDTISHTYSFDSPIPKFEISNACQDSMTIFTDLSYHNTSEIVGWYWNLGEGIDDTTSIQSPSKEFDSVGVFSIVLTIEDDIGCFQSDTTEISVNPLPIADFFAPTSCIQNMTPFSDSSSSLYGLITGWSWNFGDNNTSNVRNPQHNFDDVGTYSVELIVSDSGGCDNSIIKDVTIISAPVANFTFDSLCYGDSTHFTDLSIDTSSTINQWQWDFGNGTLENIPNPVIIFGHHEIYGVKLKVINDIGCFNSIIYDVNRSAAEPLFETNNICQDTVASFTDISEGSYESNVVSWNWEFGDDSTSNEQNPLHLYDTTGIFYVKLNIIDSRGCHDSLISRIDVYDLPNIDFGYSTVCSDNSIRFINKSICEEGDNLSYFWDFGTGDYSIHENPEYNYDVIGIFPVKLMATNSNGCTIDTSRDVTVYQPPLPQFLSDTVCLGDETSFNDLSINNGVSISRWFWDFNDDSSSVQQNPKHTFSESGIHTVGLTVVNDSGCIEFVNGSVYVNTVYSAFTLDSVCEGVASSFIDSSLSFIGFVDSWNWDFGDGNVSTERNPEFLLTKKINSVKLTVTNEAGCTDSINRTIINYSTPSADFTNSIVCKDISGVLLDNSTSDVAITNWNWSFGDGNTSVLSNPNHSYSTSGEKEISLAITNSNGCKDTISKPIDVSEAIADFASDSICLGMEISFVNTSTSVFGTNSTWNWDFSDGSTAQTEFPTHIFANTGLYQVELEVSNSLGCTNKIVKNILVHDLPQADFTPEEFCVGVPTVFFDQSSSISSIESRDWDFGDSSSVDQNPVYTFYSTANRSITLTVTDANGCSDSISKNITIYDATADFSATTVCENLSTLFNNQSTASNSQLTDYIWDFGDNHSSNIENPNNTYENAGRYNVQLIVKEEHACVDTITKEVVVLVVPETDFLADHLCENDTAVLTDNTNTNNVPISSWNWKYNGSTISYAQNTSYQFPSSGSHALSLIVINDDGCADTTQKMITIHTAPMVNYSVDDTAGCEEFTLDFINLSSPLSGVTCLWGFGDESTSNQIHPKHTYVEPGSYLISLELTTTQGCVASLPTQTYITVYSLPRFDLGADTIILIGDSVQLNTNTQSMQIEWSPIEGLSGPSMPNPIASPLQTTNYTAIVTNQYGCQYQDEIIIFVSEEAFLLLPNAFSPNGDGNNDELKLIHSGIKEVIRYEIYNRWGHRIFETTDLETAWDGTNKGVLQEIGTYVYIVEGISILDNVIINKGNVTLLR